MGFLRAFLISLKIIKSIIILDIQNKLCYIVCNKYERRFMENTSFTIRDFPIELYRKFKARCAEEGWTLKEGFIRLVKAFLEGKLK